MRIAYTNGNPITKITVVGTKGVREYDAYLDTGAAKTLIPEDDAIYLGLLYAGDIEIITGTGKDTIKLFRAEIFFLCRRFRLSLLGRNLPEQAGIKAIIGRDILDNYKVTFKGITREVVITLDNGR